MPETVEDGSSPSTGVTPPPGGDAANPGAAAANPNPNESDADRNWRRLREDADYWRDRAQQLEADRNRSASQPSNTTPPAAREESTAVKTLADFKFDEVAYGAYLRESLQTETRETVRKELEAERARLADTATRATFESRATEFAKSNPDYASAVSNPRFTQSPTLAREIMRREMGPAVAFYLSQNLGETAKLNQMADKADVREALIEIEGKLKANKAAATTNQLPGVTVPPNPPPKIGGDGESGTSGAKAPEKMTDDEWWNARKRAERRAKK